MNLRYLVPALGIIISSSGALFAENLGGLTVGGYVDTAGTISDTEESGGGSQKYFSSAVELRIGYKVGDKVTAQIDIEYNNNTDGDITDLEQAYVNYAISDTFSLTTGKFTSYAGWTAADADGLYRINASPIVSLYQNDLIGVAANFAPSEDLGVSLFLVNGMFTLPGRADVSLNDTGNEHVAVGADAVYKVKDVGSFNLEAGYDQVTADASLFQIGFNATIKLASYEPLTLGGEVLFNSYSDDGGDADGLGLLAMANHTIPSAPFPMSGTFMFTLVSDSVSPDGGGDTDTDTMELAVALLTNPTGDSHFGVNAELAYQVFSGDTGVGPTPGSNDDQNSILFALEAIAVIP